MALHHRGARFLCVLERVMGNNIIIDPEFSAIIPPLSTEERRQLEENLIDYGGARDPIVVWMLDEWKPEDSDTTFNADDYQLSGDEKRIWEYWEDENEEIYHIEDWPCILLDGHNRYEICTRLGLSFDIQRLRFNSRAEAADWIDKNQLGRRNLTPDQMSILRGRRYNRVKKSQGGTGANQYEQSAQFAHSAKTSETLAEEYNVNQATIRRDGQFAAAVETLGIEQDVMRGAIDAPRQQIVRAARLLPEKPTLEEVQRVVEIVRRTPVVTYNTGDNEWYTPVMFIELARQVMGAIDLDPASCVAANEVVQAKKIYTIEDDGLVQPWSGRVWLNPPYSSDLIGKFCDKVVAEYQQGNISAAMVLVNNSTETLWFRTLVQCASAIVFPHSRIKFWKPEGGPGAPTQGQAIVYIGPDYRRFLQVFQSVAWGAIVNE